MAHEHQRLVLGHFSHPTFGPFSHGLRSSAGRDLLLLCFLVAVLHEAGMVSFLPREAQDLSLLVSLMTCRPPLFSPEPRLRVWSQLHTAERKGGKRYSLETCEREGREKKPSITNFLHSDCLQKEKKKKGKETGKKSLSKEPVLKQPDLCRVPGSRSVLLAEEAPKNPRRETTGFHSPRQQQHSCYGDHQASFTPLPHFSPAYGMLSVPRS